jgi:dephospho-CoA kinase
MIKVGLTGNIGAGKTTVAKIFENNYGIPVFYSDECAREAENVHHIRKQFIEIVGEEILVDGQIDRNKLRQIVFNNKEIIEKVNQLISPYIMEEFNKFVELKRKEGDLVVVCESAILIEKGAMGAFDVIITVVADKQTRLKRTMLRDGLSEDMVLAKMNNQLSDDEKIEYSNAVIINEDMPNTNTKLLLEKQIELIVANLDNLGLIWDAR